MLWEAECQRRSVGGVIVPVKTCVGGDCGMCQWRGVGVGCASGEVCEW